MSFARTFGTALLLSTALMPVVAQAAPPGVVELLRQADYWKSRGRGDLATQAYRRALAVDPGNAAARAGLQNARPAPAPAARPAAAPAVRQVRAPAPTPTPVARPAPAAAPVTGGGGGDRARAAGFDALDRGDLNTAAARFQTALKARPNDADALGGLGVVRLRTKRFAEARDLLTRASRGGSGGQWAEALASARFFADLDAATAARDKGRLTDAEAQARRLLNQRGGDSAAATALLADILGRQGRFAEAATLYGNAAANTTRGAAAADLRGKASLAEARQAEANMDVMGADRAYQAAIASDPTDPWSRYEYARFLLGQNQQAAAVAAISPLEQRVSPEATFATALFWNQAGQPARADTLMARIPSDQRTAEMTGFMREVKIGAAIAQARSLHAGGRTNEALAGLRMVAGYPDLTVSALGQLADAFQTMDDPASAQVMAQQALSRPAADPQDYASIVSVLAQGGQDGAASALVQKVMAANGGRVTPAIGRLNAGLAAAQADRLRLAGQYAPAFDVLQSAWTSAPNDRDILGALGRLYQSGGMGAQAMSVYEMLLRQSPNDVAALIGVADGASSAGEKSRARAAVSRAMQVQPANPDVYLVAARVEQAAGDRGAAVKYLKRAREVYARKTMLTGGAAFLPANPFSGANGMMGGMAGGAPANGGNPFAQGGGMPGMVPASASYGGASPFQPMAMGQPMGGGYGGVPSFQSLSVPYSAPTGQGAAPMPGGFAPSQAYAAGPAPGAAMPTPLFGAPPSAGFGGGGMVSDPTLQRINSEIASLTENSGPSVTASTNFRNRSGEAGLSRLNEIGARVEIGTSVGGNGRVSIAASPVVLDSGAPSRSGLARFGRNGTPEAQGIVAEEPSQLVAARTQHETGVAVEAKASVGSLSADVGSTPLGFRRVNVQGSVSWSPRPTPDTLVRVFAERRPVTDSVLAYAGAVDPVSGQEWGSVMKSGGGASVSFDRSGNGVYADAAYRVYRGRNVRNNNAIEANVGGYLALYRTDTQRVTAGVNLNYQSYGNDQNYFTFGHGGYFSPQSFVSLAFPVRYAGTFGDLEVTADAAPGYQSFDQEGGALYPTSPAEQAQLDALKAENTDVRSRYDSLSRSGFGFAGTLGGTYRIGTATKVGGEVKYNTFGQYNEFQTNLKITQAIGGQ